MNSQMQKLEERLCELVEVVERLSEENAHLRKEQDTLRVQHSEFSNKYEKIRVRIESMVGRLKSLEKS